MIAISIIRQSVEENSELAAQHLPASELQLPSELESFWNSHGTAGQEATYGLKELPNSFFSVAYCHSSQVHVRQHKAYA